MPKQAVWVHWDDARSDDGWSEESDLKMQPAQITTLGFLLKETEDLLCVASSVDAHTQQVSGIMFIPKACVRMVGKMGLV